MTDRRLRRTCTSLLLFGATALAACGKPSGAAETQAPAAATVGAESILVLEERILRSGPSLSGDLVPEREAVIRAELDGSVVRVAVEAGQTVTTGQLLAAIDESVVADQHRSAKMGLVSAENAAQVAARELERAQRLTAGGAIAERDLEVAERSQVASNAQLENAKAVLSAAERQLQKTRLRAPFPGIVSERTVSVGDVVQTGTALFTVVDPSSMRLEATAPVSALAALKVGSQVEFQVSGYDGRAFSGRVLRINPTVDPGTRQVRITVAIPNQGNNLVAGLFARGRVTADERTAVAVPFSALDQRGAIPTLRRIRGGRVETVAVTLGLRDEILEMVQVLSGVAAGDSILRAGAAGLAPGTAVVVTKE
jgi:RND family efflux transporter MFP subunit